jgi:RNA recognition motif-containing protein
MNLYVSNLMSHITEEELKKIFSACGHVSSCRIISDKFTGVSRGFGFVEMPERADAEKAIRELGGKDVGGRSISVAEARERNRPAF